MLNSYLSGIFVSKFICVQGTLNITDEQEWDNKWVNENLRNIKAKNDYLLMSKSFLVVQQMYLIYVILSRMDEIYVFSV